uniref:OT3 n=1 Tax=synthetic construct TaxID=32630 RepID=UPI0022EC9A98|nr:Chain A, OT3 [synthetic construct]
MHHHHHHENLYFQSDAICIYLDESATWKDMKKAMEILYKLGVKKIVVLFKYDEKLIKVAAKVLHDLGAEEAIIILIFDIDDEDEFKKQVKKALELMKKLGVDHRIIALRMTDEEKFKKLAKIAAELGADAICIYLDESATWKDMKKAMEILYKLGVKKIVVLFKYDEKLIKVAAKVLHDLGAEEAIIILIFDIDDEDEFKKQVKKALELMKKLGVDHRIIALRMTDEEKFKKLAKIAAELGA